MSAILALRAPAPERRDTLSTADILLTPRTRGSTLGQL